MGERPAAPRESARPPFAKLVFGSFLMVPGPGFRAAKPAIWAAASNRRRRLARINIPALPLASANRIAAAKHSTYPLLQARPFRKPRKRRTGSVRYRHLPLPRITDEEMPSPQKLQL